VSKEPGWLHAGAAHRENARLRKELEGTRHPGALVGPRGASSETQ
jgi:hypothetical protein